MDSCKHDNLYLRMAIAIGVMCSYCERLKVGCLLVKNGHIIGNGYNGTAPGDKNICEMTDPEDPDKLVTNPEVIHAEINAITKCSRAGIPTEGATAYVAYSPCVSCAKALYMSGIKRVVFADFYRDTKGLEFLIKNNVNIHRIESMAKLLNKD